MRSDRAFLTRAFDASRPVSWVNTAYPFAAAYLLATREVDLTLIIGTLYFLVPYNLAVYGINDVFDYASDLANPRKDSIEGALLPPRMHRPLLWLVAATNLPFIVWFVAVGDPWVWLTLAIALFAVVAYSAPVLRFKERPFLDSATSATHFVAPATVGLAMAGASPGLTTVLVLAAFFFWCTAAHAFGAVQDIGPDREAGLGSIATALGARTTVRLAIAMWVLSGLLMLFTPWPWPLAGLLVVPYLVNCAPYRNVTDATAFTTNRAWRRFLALNYLSGFLLTMLLIAAWPAG